MTGDSPQQVAEGVHRVADGVVNYYLVEDGGQVALIDTGWPRSWPRIEAALAAIGRSPGDVAAVLLTHGHPDHMGAAVKARETTGAPVRANHAEVARLRGEAKGASPFSLVPGLATQMWRPVTLAFVLQATAKGFMTPTWLKTVDPFSPGETLDAPGKPAVVATPGHTEGHVSFHLAERGVVFAGDALVTRDPVSGATGPRLMHDVVNADTAGAEASLTALEGLAADTLLPGHGAPWRGSPRDAVARAR